MRTEFSPTAPAGRRLGRWFAAVLVTLVTLGASACGTDSKPAANEQDASGAYPVTIESALGKAVIKSPPKRIVTIGWGTEDIVFALGTVPVGVERDDWSGDADGYRPWFREAVEKAGAQLPTTFATLPEIDMDTIVSLRPDLILAPQSGLTQDDFDVLNDLAPTVAYPERAWATPWDTQIRLVGKALGKTAEAEAMIKDIADQFAAVAAKHPEFQDVTFAYIYAAEPGQLHLYQRQDPRVEFIARLGLKEVPELAAMKLSEGRFTTDLGLEQADLLNDVDVIFTWFNDADNKAKIEAQPLYARIPAVKRGSYVVTLDRSLSMAGSLITPLSVPWAMDRYVALISDAVKKLD